MTRDRGAVSGCAGLLICPVCTEPLTAEGRTLRCPRGHAFDFAREGHVDLLPAGHGRSTLTGDTAEMLRARRRFLERGWFAPLARALEDCRAALADDVAPDHGRGLVLLEVGCGEGYFIGGLAASSNRTAGPDGDCCFGLDISRDALRMAARRHPGVLFFRNDVHYRICLRDGCVDLLLDIFAPRNPREFRRVLRPGGRVVVLEFSKPTNALIRGLYNFYFNQVMTRTAGWISGDATAYRYLSASVETFKTLEQMKADIESAGFSDVEVHPLTFGVAVIYVGFVNP